MLQVETIPDLEGCDIRSSVNQLSDNTLSAIRIPEIFSAEELDIIISNIGQRGVQWYPNFEFLQGRIGISATEYESKIHGKEAYFVLEAEASRIRDEIFPDNLDPVKKISNIFSRGFDTSIAEEPIPGHSRYFTGLIRAMGQESTIHFDYAPRQLPGWAVADAETQLGVVVYLQKADEGGQLTIFHRQWTDKDDEHNKDTVEKGPNGFRADFLADEEYVTLAPEAGEMIVFNSRNFHKVQRMASSMIRLSVNTFASVSGDQVTIWN